MKLFKQLRWFFFQEWHHYLGAITLLILIALLQLMQPKLVGIIVDKIILENSTDYRSILQWLIIIIFIAILIYVLRYIWRILLFGAAYRLAVKLRDKLYYLLSQQLPEFYLRHRTGDLIAQATNDVDRVVFAAGEGVLTLVDSLVLGCSVLLVMSLNISWQLTILTLLPMPIMAFIVKNDGHRLHKSFQIAQASFSSLSNQTQEILSNIRMIKSFGLEKYQLSTFGSIVRNTSDKNMEVAKIDARFDPIIYLSVGISNLLALCGGSWLVINNNLTFGQLTSFIMYLGLMIWPMLALAWMFNIVERGSAAYGRINQTLNEWPKIKDGNLPIPFGLGKLKIMIKEFYYPQTKNCILQNIYIDLTPGEILGVCGPTGCGKSTLVSLILRQFSISEGEIFFHNLPLKTIQLDQWRKRLAVANQTTFLFSDTIASNIALGKPNATYKQIEEVARLACIHDDIENFSHGYQTKIGEKGVTLSGGQKQRIAIARALLLKSEILILDDALSAVEECIEYNILLNLRQSIKNKTIIIISHRLSALKEADKIIVLKKGKIYQRGKHSSLINKPGWYRDMYYHQQLGRTLGYKFNFNKR